MFGEVSGGLAAGEAGGSIVAIDGQSSRAAIYGWRFRNDDHEKSTTPRRRFVDGGKAAR
jgi:hypothetical protein